VNLAPFTDRDIKYLQRMTSPLQRRFLHIGGIFCIVFFITTAGINAYFSHRFSELADKTFEETVVDWFRGIDLEKNYSGVYLKAQERWEVSLFLLTAAGIMAVMYIFACRTLAQNQKLLKFLENNST
jgi:hypothetical protein